MTIGSSFGSGSQEKVALELMQFLMSKGVSPAASVEGYLELYGQCLRATQGRNPVVVHRKAIEQG